MRAVLICAGLLAAWPVAAQQPDTRYCSLLIAQFDRFAGRQGSETGSSAGLPERTIGARRCQEGRVEEGERLLIQALRNRGYQPAPRP